MAKTVKCYFCKKDLKKEDAYTWVYVSKTNKEYKRYCCSLEEKERIEREKELYFCIQHISDEILGHQIENNARNKKIVVFTKDYKSYIYDVIGYSTGIVNRKTYGKLILSKTADVNIPKEHVTMISFLNLVRFESDELRLDYESNVVALTSVTLKEVDDV